MNVLRVGLAARIAALKTLFGIALLVFAPCGEASEAWAQEEGQVEPQAVRSRFGMIRFNGLLQAWYLSRDVGLDDAFLIRRAELRFTGEISPEVRWTVMVDPANSRILQDAFITLSYRQRLHVSVGQFKVPLGLEGLQPSEGLDTERALFTSDRARGGTYGDIRDVGVMVHGPLANRVDFQLAVFDVSGGTTNDPHHDQEAVAGRVIYRPGLVPGLQLGTSGFRGDGSSLERSRRDRLGAELLYGHGRLTLKTEYMSGTDGPLQREGYYAHFAYKITSKWESILRYDTWDPDVRLESSAGSVTERDYIAGFNYFIHGGDVKLQFNYVRKTFDNIVAPVNVGVLRLQACW